MVVSLVFGVESTGSEMSVAATVLSDREEAFRNSQETPASRYGAVPDLNDPHRQALLNELDRRFSASNGSRRFNRARPGFYRKKTLWGVVINGVRFLKRAIDISGSATALVLLAPLSAAVTAAIRLTDGEPALPEHLEIIARPVNGGSCHRPQPLQRETT